MKELYLLKQKLTSLFPWNQARVGFIAQFVLALLDAQTANLNTLALKFKGRAKIQSHYKRIQRFFRSYAFDFDHFARVIVKLMPVGDKWVLCVDRTNWKFGKKNINLMVLGIAHNGVCIPLLWSFLDKRGCSNMTERIALMERFLNIFPASSIECVTADREFIGREWILFLQKHHILFRIRIRKNTVVRSARSHLNMGVYRLFCGTFQRPTVLRKKRNVWGVSVYLIGLRTADDYVILMTNEKPLSAMKDYKKRWNIEMLFSCLKTRGFDFETTHLSKSERVNKLMALLTLAFCWCILQGETFTSEQKLTLKKHGYPAKSVFRIGLESLTNLLANTSCKFKEFRRATDLFVL